MLENLRTRARALKREVVALYFAARDPETPIVPKVIAWVVAAYVLSPLDLIPDFIPVLGLLDDLILVPIGINLAIRMIPPHVMQRARERADNAEGKPRSLVGLVIVVAIWLGTLAGITIWFLHRR